MATFVLHLLRVIEVPTKLCKVCLEVSTLCMLALISFEYKIALSLGYQLLFVVFKMKINSTLNILSA